MAEKAYFFDSTENDERIYQAADFARFHAQIIGNGVSNTASQPDLEVTATTNMDVALGAGYCFANGYMYENTSTMTLTHDIADPNNSRFDRVVIRFDNNPAQRTIKAMIKKGIPSSNPVAPTLQRDNYIYEMSMALVLIINGRSFIDDIQIVDERANADVCGYIPLHNIYRGMQINEAGMVTMPNQSYIEMNSMSSRSLSGTEQPPDNTEFYINRIPIAPLIDNQNEIINGKMYIRAKGTYLFTIHTRRIHDSNHPDNKKLEAYLSINGNLTTNNRLYLFNGYLTESQHYGANVKMLNKGDVVELILGRRFLPKVDLDYIRLNIAKIN